MPRVRQHPAVRSATAPGGPQSRGRRAGARRGHGQPEWPRELSGL